MLSIATLLVWSALQSSFKNSQSTAQLCYLWRVLYIDIRGSSRVVDCNTPKMLAYGLKGGVYQQIAVAERSHSIKSFHNPPEDQSMLSRRCRYSRPELQKERPITLIASVTQLSDSIGNIVYLLILSELSV